MLYIEKKKKLKLIEERKTIKNFQNLTVNNNNGYFL